MRLAFLLVLLAAALPAVGASRSYDVEYLARFVPAEKVAKVTITLDHDTGRATRLSFAMPAQRYLDVEGDGEVRREGDRVVWVPPRAGGKLRYAYRVDKRRANGSYGARMTERWAILRGDDLFPRVSV